PFLSSSSPVAHRDLHSFPTRRSSDLPPEDTMTIRTLRRIAAAALVLCTALPAWAQPGDAAARPIAVQMYTLRNAGSLEEQFKIRSEEHTSELQSRENLVCRLLLEKKK